MPNSLQVIIILAATNLERLCQAVLTLLLYSFTECILNNILVKLAYEAVASYCTFLGKKIKSLVESIL